MDEFLKELADLMERHEVTILRSAVDGDIVVSMLKQESRELREEVFSADLDATSIRRGWHQSVTEGYRAG